MRSGGGDRLDRQSLEDLGDGLVDRSLRDLARQRQQLPVQRDRRPGRRSPGLDHPVIQPPRAAQLVQLAVGHPAQRRAQDPDERDPVVGRRERAQDVDGIDDLLSGEEPPLALHDVRNVSTPQRIEVHVDPGERAQQDRRIPRRGRMSPPVPPADLDPPEHRLGQPPGETVRLRFPRGVGAERRPARTHDAHHRPQVPAGRLRRGRDRRVGGLHPGTIFEQAFTHRVHRRQDRAAAAEVRRQCALDPALIEHGLDDRLVRLDVRAAKTVNRLFLIAHDEQLTALQADAPPVRRRAPGLFRQEEQNLVLDGVGILTLVDQQCTKATLERLADVPVIANEIPRAGEQPVEGHEPGPLKRRAALADERHERLTHPRDGFVVDGGEEPGDLHQRLRAIRVGFVPPLRRRAHVVADRLRVRRLDRPPPLRGGLENPLGRGELLFDLAPLGMGREQLADVSEAFRKPLPGLGRRRRRRVERRERNRLGAQTAGDREQLVEARALQHAPPQILARGVRRQLPAQPRRPRRVDVLAPARLVGLGKARVHARLDRKEPQQRRREPVDRPEVGAIKIAQGGAKLRPHHRHRGPRPRH